MNLACVGVLHQHPDVKEWLQSSRVPIPYFDGRELQFVIEDVKTDAKSSDFEAAITAFMSLGEQSDCAPPHTSFVNTDDSQALCLTMNLVSRYVLRPRSGTS